MAIGEVPARGNVIPCIPARYILSVLSSIGMAIIYGLKVNLSVAMVAMVNHTAVEMEAHKSGDAHGAAENITGRVECEADPVANGTSSGNEDGPFVWDTQSQGIILSCYFWGYLVSQIPGSMIAAKFSAKWVMWFAVFINVVCTILTPPSAYWSIWAVVLMRVLEGIGGGVTFPAEHTLIAAWAPPSERSTISSIIYAGTALGTVISMLMAGILAALWGWASIFYVMGGLSCIWLVLWIIFIQDSPDKQGLIDQSERDFINNSLSTGSGGHHGPPKVIPWKLIFTSAPFLGILIAHVCNNWGWYMLLIELPIYMKGVLKFPIKELAIFTSVPFLTLWFFSIAISKTLDTLRAKNVINTTSARKIATMFASVIPMFCLLALCFIGCRKMLAVLIAGIGVTSIGAMFSGFLSNHIDLSPNYAGILMAITNSAATFPGIIVPNFVGYLTHKDPTIGSWQIVFGVTIVLYIIEIICYLWLASGELQPWNNPEGEKTGPEMTPLKDKNQTDYKTKDEA